MEFLEKQQLANLKSQFFDFLVENDEGQLLNMIEQLLLFIKMELQLEEVTLFLYNEWKQYYFPDASTNEAINNKPDSYFMTSDEVKRLGENQSSLDLETHTFSLITQLTHNNKEIGLYQFKYKQTGTSSALLVEVAKECSKLIEKINKMTKVFNEGKRYEQLFNVTAKFYSSMNMDDVLGEVIYTLRKVYPSFTYFLLLSHDNHNNHDLPIKDFLYDNDENPAAMQAYVTGEIQFEDSIKDKRSALYAPLKGKQGVYGVLQVIAPSTVIFPYSEVRFIDLLANTAGSALENAKLYQQSKRLIADLQLINETSHRLNSSLRLTDTMNFMSEQIIKSFNAQEVGFILFLNDKIDVLPGSTTFFQTEKSKQYIGYANEKIKDEKDTLFIGDITIEPSLQQMKYHSLMAVPMVQSGFIKGVAIVLHELPYHFSFETFKLLQSLIHHSTLAFTNSMLREELEKLVITDHLTNLYSRSYLDETINLSMETDAYGTFILIDLDNFKCINDMHGHQVGDKVLIQVANILKESIRDNDIGARWGGEELAIYLPKVELDAGIAIAERVVQKVEQSTSPKITISCGISYWNAERQDTAFKLFKRADKALYIAKETGKNRVIIEEVAKV
ncbi:diguanylate cyclase [Cytobacillus sp. S13-E01]|uniref:sensor domain-containing diguanylate cyclase n=1 Tax=Cytobacillus sp. S13-E01 TaxID=3031326 RepID=UPI0023D7DFFF|nr:diguanylate cyclase [Cytobacillus sp. S13-E01]MDF0726443.1 diguanylate cyclase [Cytobacillus sp. S13-E01]